MGRKLQSHMGPSRGWVWVAVLRRSTPGAEEVGLGRHKICRASVHLSKKRRMSERVHRREGENRR